MTIKYYLQKGTLPGMEGTYSLRFSQSSSVNLEEIAKELSSQGSTVSEPDIQAVLTSLVIQLKKYVLSECAQHTTVYRNDCHDLQLQGE